MQRTDGGDAKRCRWTQQQPRKPLSLDPAIERAGRAVDHKAFVRLWLERRRRSSEQSIRRPSLLTLSHTPWRPPATSTGRAKNIAFATVRPGSSEGWGPYETSKLEAHRAKYAQKKREVPTSRATARNGQTPRLLREALRVAAPMQGKARQEKRTCPHKPLRIIGEQTSPQQFGDTLSPQRRDLNGASSASARGSRSGNWPAIVQDTPKQPRPAHVRNIGRIRRPPGSLSAPRLATHRTNIGHPQLDLETTTTAVGCIYRENIGP